MVENLLRSIPENLCLNLDLSLIKIPKIFKWFKKQNLSDSEMMKTFNCGIGFCIILPEKNISKISEFFSKKFKPYKIGQISSKRKSKVNLIKTLKW